MAPFIGMTQEQVDELERSQEERTVHYVLEHRNLLTFVRFATLDRDTAYDYCHKLEQASKSDTAEFHRFSLRRVIMEERFIRCIESDEIRNKGLTR